MIQNANILSCLKKKIQMATTYPAHTQLTYVTPFSIESLIHGEGEHVLKPTQ